MAELVLCCGKICSGKSTFAKRLETGSGFFPFSADDWMLHFYEETADRQLFDLRLAKCKSMIFSLAYKLLEKGQNVVLDFGFWTKAERMAAYADAERRGFRTTIVYFPIAYEEQVVNMQRRQAEATGRHYSFDERAVRELNLLFEEPDGTERVVLQEAYEPCRR